MQTNLEEMDVFKYENMKQHCKTSKILFNRNIHMCNYFWNFDQ